MPTDFPAFQLLLTMSFSLLLGLPILVWLFLHGNRDTGVKLWFAAIFINALGIVLVGHFRTFTWFTAAMFAVALVPAIESMRWELQRKPIPLATVGLGCASYALLHWWLNQQGMRMTVGYSLNLVVLLAGEIWLLQLLWKVRQLRTSRGLWVVIVGVALICLPNAYRLVRALIEGHGHDVFAGSASANVALVMITLVSVLHVVGYGGFTIEKLHQRKLVSEKEQTRAKEQQRLAEIHAHEMENVVRERDDMILMISRFSAVNNLALYNSAIVHEISQPLQALLSILDGMSLRDSAHQNPPSPSVQHAQSMVQKMAATLTTLRTLMAGQRAPMEPLTLDEVLDELLPILQTQAQRQRVGLQRQVLGPANGCVQANRVLLQRVILNAVTNAFESLQSSKTHEGRVLLTTGQVQDHGITYSVLRVQDNGPGLPDGLVLKPGLALRTTKDDGLGVGLSFAKMVVESWRGELLVYNDMESSQMGAIVEIRLPSSFQQTIPS